MKPISPSSPSSSVSLRPSLKVKTKSGFSNLVFFLKRNPLATMGLILFLVIFLASVFAPLLTPYQPTSIDIRNKLDAPSLEHPLGTDNFGRDILSRILYGGRNTLTIGVMVIVIAFSAGVSIGIFSGFTGGVIDTVIMRITDAMLSFPTLVLAIALAAALGPSLENAMIAVALTLTPQFARVARGQSLSIRQMLYIEAATSIGIPKSRILWRYVLPNSLGPLLVQASLSLGSAILQTAGLGFLGLGAQPPLPEWGADISASSQYLRESPWVAFAPGMAILLSVLAFNLIGDALVDWFNPRTRKEA